MAQGTYIYEQVQRTFPILHRERERGYQAENLKKLVVTNTIHVCIRQTRRCTDEVTD
jgi:hypothetical protein